MASVDLPAPPVKVTGRVASAPDNPVLAPAVLVPVDVRAVEKLAVELPALKGGVTMVGTVAEEATFEVLGLGNRVVEEEAAGANGAEDEEPADTIVWV